jgi:hypothetical protein
MMCPSCGQGKLRSYLHVCKACGDEYIGEVAAKHLDRIAKEFNQIRLDHLRRVEKERDEAREALSWCIEGFEGHFGEAFWQSQLGLRLQHSGVRKQLCKNCLGTGLVGEVPDMFPCPSCSDV